MYENKSIKKNSLRYFIEVSYNGKAYHGWQNQPNAVTVQEILEHALTTLLQESVAVVGAGRTDAGVHALQMFAHFDTASTLKEQDLIFKLNAFLPAAISVIALFKVTEEAHARFDALSRSYLYRISTTKNPFTIDFAYRFTQSLDVDAMNEAAKILLQYVDFQCFSKSNTDVKTYNCKIEHAIWKQVDDELHFEITADRFLRNMVRAIVGTLIEIGTGKLQVENMHTIIKSKNRAEAGYSVPAHGLYLTQITYPDSIKQQ